MLSGPTQAGPGRPTSLAAEDWLLDCSDLQRSTIPVNAVGSAARIGQMATRMHDEEFPIDERLVRELLSAQMPRLANRTLYEVEPWGTANAIWRLGDDLVVRLPRVAEAERQIDGSTTGYPGWPRTCG